jgi:D-alanine-D-alanine ligase
VSLLSGAAVVKALRSLGHTVDQLDPRDDSWTLPTGTEVVFLALHGTYGEDGTVQRRLDEIGVPYTGCDAESSRIAFDKILTKKRCLESGVPTARYIAINSPTASWPLGWNPPVVLKPARQGSSVGLQFVERVADWSKALAASMRYDSQVVMEERIDGREMTVGILGEETLPIVEVRPKKGVYDYETKYSVGASEYLCPAPLEDSASQRVCDAALGAFRAVGGRDYGRIDIILKPSGEPVVLEVNTLPGMTETSLLPKAAAAAGFNYEQLCQRMIDLALERSPKLVTNH